jgi:hypothetical protein
MADAETFVYKTYKGHDIELPLTDKMREYLTKRSKDSLIQECDAVWANLMNKPDEEEVEESDEEFSYSELKKQELVAEIDDRNKDRAEEDKIVIPSGSNKADLIALLETDDLEEPEEEDEDEDAETTE